MDVAESLRRFLLLSRMELSSHAALGSLPTAVLKTSGLAVAMCSSTVRISEGFIRSSAARGPLARDADGCPGPRRMGRQELMITF